MELPPRARRIRGWGFTMATSHGTTSACAENTLLLLLGGILSRNYLRVRGEYSARVVGDASPRELPPRARRILGGAPHMSSDQGTTSACAENTGEFECGFDGAWNYLRVRGEYWPDNISIHDRVELPPRARRIRRPSSQHRQ